MPFVYILESIKSGKYYIGCTMNHELRLNLHNAGKVKSTKTNKPWKRIFLETHSTLSAARSREKQLKSRKKRRAIENMIKRLGPVV